MFFERTTLKDFQFVNEPEPYHREDYERCLKGVVDRLASHPGIEGIYQVGRVNHPGVSDLDLLVVFKDDYRSSQIGIDVREFSPEERFFFTHQLYIIPRRLLDALGYVFPLFSLRPMVGPPLAEPPKREKTADTVFLTDFAVLRWPREFVEIFLKGVIEQRRCLGRLISLRYTFKLYEEVTGDVQSRFQTFVQEVDALCQNWFTLEAEERKNLLLKQLKESILLLQDILERFSSYLERERIIRYDFHNGWFGFFDKQFPTVFRNDVGREEALEKVQQGWQQWRIPLSILPKVFSFSMLHYTQVVNPLGRHFHSVLHLNGFSLKGAQIATPYREFLEKRLSFLNEHLTFLSTLHSAYGYFMNFGYIPPFNAKFRIRHSLESFGRIRMRKRLEQLMGEASGHP